MKKWKFVIIASILSAFVFSLVSIWVFEGDWPFLPYLLIAGFFMVAVQEETVTYKFLNKLLFGALLFGFLTTFLIVLRMYLMSRYVYETSFPILFWLESDTLAMSLVFSFVSFLGGLFGIILKGFYNLYKDRLDKIIILIGPFFVLFSSLAVFKTKIGGTILSSYHGWPYSFFVHQIKDVVDGFSIDKWIFSPGSFYYYFIFNYLFYFLILFSFYYLLEFINRKNIFKNINRTFFLFVLLVIIIVALTSFLSMRRSYISHQISEAAYCESDSECVIVGSKCPFSCAIVANGKEAKRLLDLVNSFPATCELNCLGGEEAVCLKNKCQVSISQALAENGEDLWQKIKQSIENCEVNSISQLHSREVTVVLKTGEAIKTIEPEIDDIFDLQSQSEEKCGKIILSTE